MALVAMMCPNCNGPMEPEKSHFRCSHCQTIMLNIIDAEIDDDVTIMTPDEFAKRLEESKRSFIININDNLQEFDIDTLIINKQIKDATELLDSEEYERVHSALDGVSNKILSAERLRYLASYKVQDEYELSYIDGYVDGYNYKNLISLCDEETRKTYEKVEAYTRQRHDTKVAIEKEIKEAERLYKVELYEEAIAYSKEMCRKYPQIALSWYYACESKARAGRIDYEQELEKMKLLGKTELPPTIKDNINGCKQDAIRNKTLEAELEGPRSMVAGAIVGFFIFMIATVAFSFFLTEDSDAFEYITSLSPTILISLVFLGGAILVAAKDIIPKHKKILKKEAFLSSWKEKLPEKMVDEIAQDFVYVCKTTLKPIILNVLAIIFVLIFISILITRISIGNTLSMLI